MNHNPQGRRRAETREVVIEKPPVDNSVERRRNRMTDKIADGIQYIVLAIIVGLGSILLTVRSEQDKMGVTVASVNTSIIALQQKLEIMSDAKVNKSDFTLDKAALYERLRGVEADQKIMADGLRKIGEQTTEITKQLAEMKGRR